MEREASPASPTGPDGGADEAFAGTTADPADPADPADRADLADRAGRELGQDLRRSIAAIYRRFRSLRAQGELGESATEVLAAITAAGPLTLSELADRDRVALSTISQTVNRLEKLGYVVREPDRVDRRRVRIVPTDAGAAIAASDREKRHAWFDRLIAELDPADRAALERSARILRELAEV
ncbi:MarR family winged helix-turn-helix transcriptional regulator [Schumannella sp. 10F1B-5-1]|uniref:MarR family winged helix-turn-helix transcriptional regulator n=1 Tax=Schumannella sp. 10F1B-5-1 TaxID=2590780 RepID=UPI00113059C5|nr:MarR family transcriptional regulator [Schumannella sp. 10F1B-5-1]TPW71688.1 MarR family transcriptional regulator [Schumannella sp. 10F1B-5-1]